MILKQCRKCKKLIIHPETYCEDCKPLIENQRLEMLKKRNKRYNNNRDPDIIKKYKSKEWHQLKNKKLQDVQYRCEECTKLATEVHHIVEAKDDISLFFVYDNLEAICIKCHNKRHNRFLSRKEREYVSNRR